MLNYHHHRTIEEILTLRFCHSHSEHAGHEVGVLKETVFTGDPDQLRGEVLAELGGESSEIIIPDCPTGLVIHASDGSGAFD